jgi:ribonucleoside-diphosphate reductase alpha chain
MKNTIQQVSLRPDSGFLSDNGIQVLAARYLKKDARGKPLESPDDLFRRVAERVAAVDSRYDGKEGVETSRREFFDAMRKLEFLPNSPTLMNAGRDLGQLSACFVLPVEDSLDSIFETVKQTALIHKSGGGTGFSFSLIRPNGDRVRSTQGVSSGPVSFMRVFDAATEAVKQGGTRRGANMGVLRFDHPDILEFIAAKAGCQDLKNFNISVAVTDRFMEDVEAGADYSLIHPVTGHAAGHLNAAEVFQKICRAAWKCGDPGILFLDRINRDNPTPWLGDIECTNPCGEQPLLPFESCNLGSINVARMTVGKGDREFVDYRRLARTVRLAVHFLDNVIDANQYPLQMIDRVSRGNRKIGLGIMGWADLLIALGLPYASEDALTLADKVMGFIRRVGQRASRDLARKRGPYPNFAEKSTGDRQIPQRNATITAIAPTGTISIIAGCSSGIEPLFALSYVRKQVLEGRELPEIHPGLMKHLSAMNLMKSGIVESVLKSGSIQQIHEIPEEMRRLYAQALEIAPEWHVRMQAAFQKHSDGAVSKTVNLASECSPADIGAVYSLAYRLGCKGITAYRDRCRDVQVLNIGCTACA